MKPLPLGVAKLKIVSFNVDSAALRSPTSKASLLKGRACVDETRNHDKPLASSNEAFCVFRSGRLKRVVACADEARKTED